MPEPIAAALPFHKLAETLSQVAKADSLKIVVGYLVPAEGESARIYRDLTMTSHIVLQRSAIRHVESLGKSKFSPAWIWITSNATVSSKPESTRTLAELATGSILRKNLSRTNIGDATARGRVDLGQREALTMAAPGDLDPAYNADPVMFATYGQSCETCGDTNPMCCISVTCDPC
jgi:hypothetical protein